MKVAKICNKFVNVAFLQAQQQILSFSNLSVPGSLLPALKGKNLARRLLQKRYYLKRDRDQLIAPGRVKIFGEQRRDILKCIKAIVILIFWRNFIAPLDPPLANSLNVVPHCRKGPFLRLLLAPPMVYTKSSTTFRKVFSSLCCIQIAQGHIHALLHELSATLDSWAHLHKPSLTNHSDAVVVITVCQLICSH